MMGKMWSCAGHLWAVLVVACGAAAAAWAETGAQGSDYDPARLSREGFVPAERVALGDQVPGGTLMLAAYLAGWVLFFAYLVFLLRAQRDVGRELGEVRRRMDELDERIEEGGGAS